MNRFKDLTFLVMHNSYLRNVWKPLLLVILDSQRLPKLAALATFLMKFCTRGIVKY